MMTQQEEFKTHCPRCDKEAIVTKTETHLITHCNDCGFDMGNLKEGFKKINWLEDGEIKTGYIKDFKEDN